MNEETEKTLIIDSISEPTSPEAEAAGVLWDLKYNPRPRKTSLDKKEKARRKKARKRAKASRKGR